MLFCLFNGYMAKAKFRRLWLAGAAITNGELNWVVCVRDAVDFCACRDSSTKVNRERQKSLKQIIFPTFKKSGRSPRKCSYRNVK